MATRWQMTNRFSLFILVILVPLVHAGISIRRQKPGWYQHRMAYRLWTPLGEIYPRCAVRSRIFCSTFFVATSYIESVDLVVAKSCSKEFRNYGILKDGTLLEWRVSDKFANRLSNPAHVSALMTWARVGKRITLLSLVLWGNFP
jgi:hypothetical protein